MKFKIAFALLIIIIFGGLFYFMDSAREMDRVKINKNPMYVKGIVVEKSSYKGRSISVKYVVNNKEYIESGGYNENDKVSIGDSITVKYAHDSPDIMITQFQEGY